MLKKKIYENTRNISKIQSNNTLSNCLFVYIIIKISFPLYFCIKLFYGKCSREAQSLLVLISSDQWE